MKRRKHWEVNRKTVYQTSLMYVSKALLTFLYGTVQFSLSVVSDSVTPWTAAHQASLSIANSQSLLKLMFIESVMPSNHLILCCPHPPPALSLSQLQGLFQCVSSLHQVAKVLEFHLQHQSFQLTFRTDFLQDYWFDLLAVQGTLKSLLQQNSSKASILQRSAFFIVRLSHAYMNSLD